MELYDELERILRAFDQHGLDYALCGGLALAIHGYVRATKDIDVLIRKEDLERVRAVVGNCGFTATSGKLPFKVGTPQEHEVHRILKVENREVLMLDLVIVTPVFEDVWATREVFEWQGRKIRVVSREGLAKMKRLAARRIDLADLENLGFLKEKGGADKP
jgi:hypothetical protein